MCFSGAPIHLTTIDPPGYVALDAVLQTLRTVNSLRVSTITCWFYLVVYDVIKLTTTPIGNNILTDKTLQREHLCMLKYDSQHLILYTLILFILSGVQHTHTHSLAFVELFIRLLLPS